MTKRRSVVLSREALGKCLPGNIEGLVCRTLREHGIPVIGMFRYGGVRTGVLRVKRNEDQSVTFCWWPTPKDALDDGVVVPDSPDSEITRNERIIIPKGVT